MPVKVYGVEELGRKLEFIAEMVSTSKTPLIQSGDWLMKDTKANFDKGGRLFQNGGWQPLKPATIKDRERKGFGRRPILKRTGQLKRKFYKRVGTGKVELYNPRPYFKYHQLGGTKIPLRRMLGIRNEAIVAIRQIFEQNINKWFRMVFK